MFSIELAGYPFTIDNRYKYIEKICKDYITDTKGTRIFVTDSEIAFENQDGGEWKNDYLESLAVYRKICELLVNNGIILFHSSALALNGKAYLFTAPSGTGKSTHARLWREHFGSRVTVINDDKPLLQILPNKVMAYGTPYGGKDGLQTNTVAEVAGIVVLRQSESNKISRLTAKDAFPILLNQTYRSKSPDKLSVTLDLVHNLLNIPIFLLECTISKEAVLMAYEALSGDNTNGEEVVK